MKKKTIFLKEAGTTDLLLTLTPIMAGQLIGSQLARSVDLVHSKVAKLMQKKGITN